MALKATKLAQGTCWTANWTLTMNQDDPSDGIDNETLYYYSENEYVNCHEISSFNAGSSNSPDISETWQVITVDQFDGLVCKNDDNPGIGCDDYEMTFCCEGCCPKLNVSGAPEVTDYYEDYPSIYVHVEETFNGQRMYRKLDGYDEFGNEIYGVGRVMKNIIFKEIIF